MTTKIKASNIDTAATDFTFGTMSVDGNLTVTGNLTIEGSTITVDTATVQTVSLGDNDKISLGDSADLQIYHNGTHSFIKDVGTGNLYIDATSLYVRSATGEPYIVGTADAGVSIYYDNALKLATTATGIDVTGTVEASDALFNGAIAGRGLIIDTATEGVTDNVAILNAQHSAGILSFKTNSIERVRIDSSGNVSIGVSSAYTGGKLSVNGGIVQPSGVQNVIGVFGTSGLQMIGVTGGDNVIGTMGAAEPLVLRTGSTERLRIDSSGNVGIGVVPEAWSALYGTKALQVGAQASLSDINGDLHLSSNAYYDTTDARWEYINADYATKYTQVDGVHQWLTAGIGTADAAITWSESMRIDSSGNVFVNGTTQIAGSKLNVRGTSAYIGVGGTVEMLFGDSGSSEGFLGTFTNHPLTLRTNNTERLRIDSSGNVGIGTGSPAEKLEVDGSIRVGNLKIQPAFAGRIGFNRNTTNGAIYNSGYSAVQINGPTTSDNYMAFETYNSSGGNGVVAMVIEEGGNIGIGTTDPGEKLEVNGILQIKRVGDHPAIRFVEDTTTRAYIGSGDWAINGLADADFGISSVGALALGYSGGVERMRIHTNGNVGIGTASPSGELDVTASKASAVTNLYVRNPDNTGGAAIRVQSQTDAHQAILGITDAGSGGRVGTLTNDDFYFVTNNTERLRINTSGNVGIGTSSIASGGAGTTNFNVHTPNTDTAYFKLSNTGTGNTTSDGFDLMVDGAGGSYVWNRENANMLFATNNTERMRIDSAGNVGIGMTPTNFGNGYTVLQVANASNGGMLYLTNTANAGGRIYGNGAGLTYDAFSTTYHAFITNSAERLRINSSGNVGIGTTNPVYPLVVSNSGAQGLEFIVGSTNWIQSYNRSTSDYTPLRIDAETISFATNNGAERMTIDSSGNVGIGTSSPTDNLTIGMADLGDASLSFRSSTYAALGAITVSHDSGTAESSMRFHTRTGGDEPERMRIDSSGNLLQGYTTGGFAGGACIKATGYNIKQGFSGALGASVFNIDWSFGTAKLWIDTTNVGTITLTSDYRIKQDVETQTEAGLSRIMALRPVTYQHTDFGTLFKADGITREGFIAHELQEVIPSAVEGEKDAENQIQSLKIDALCAVMVKAIQEQQAIITALETRLSALEGA